MKRQHISSEARVLRIIFRMFPPHLAIDRLDLSLCLRYRRSVFESADDGETARVTRLYLPVRKRERLPDISPLTELTAATKIEKLKRKIKSLRHDSNDSEAL